MADLTWKDIQDDKRYIDASPEEQGKVKKIFFEEEIETLPGYDKSLRNEAWQEVFEEAPPPTFFETALDKSSGPAI